MVGRNDGSINAGLKEIIQIIQAVAQGSAVYYIMRESWLALQLGVNSNFCRRCNATGRIICNKCHGTSTLRRRPAFFATLSDKMISKTADYYKCPYSGPRGTFDIPPTADQLEDAGSYRVHLAEEVEDLLKSAAMSRVPSRPFKALAGTVTCPECNGNVRVKTALLNIANVFGGIQRQGQMALKKAPLMFEDRLPLKIRQKPSTMGGPMHITEYPSKSVQRSSGYEERVRRLKRTIDLEKSRRASAKHIQVLEKELKQVMDYAEQEALASKAYKRERDRGM